MFCYRNSKKSGFSKISANLHLHNLWKRLGIEIRTPLTNKIFFHCLCYRRRQSFHAVISDLLFFNFVRTSSGRWLLRKVSLHSTLFALFSLLFREKNKLRGHDLSEIPSACFESYYRDSPSLRDDLRTFNCLLARFSDDTFGLKGMFSITMI